MAWTYKNIEKYNGCKRKIFVVGHSAGGYLLDIIGLDKKWLAKYGVDADSLAALVPFSGDKYLTQTDVADFRIYNYAVSNQELWQLKQKIGK